MTQSKRISSLVVLLVAVLLLAAGAVAFTVAPTPLGQLIVVNNGPDDQTEPKVDGDLVCYTNASSGNSHIRYHNLATGTDNGVPIALDGRADFQCDVRGTTIVFTRSGAQNDIFTFDIASVTLTEIAPQPGSQRFGAQIGDQTIVWQDYFGPGTTASTIVAYDRATGTSTVISPTAAAGINRNPGISPDGSVVVWENCATVTSPCSIWKAIRSGAGTWAAQQLVSQVGGNQSHPDTDGTIIAYVPLGPGTTQLAWQTVAAGTEQVLNLLGSAINPSVSGKLIAFAYDPTLSGSHDIYVFDTTTSSLYQITNTPANKSLSDISITPDGKVRVVWQVLEADWNVYAFPFNLPVGDFNLGAISPLTISAGGSGSTNVTVNPVNGFSSTVDLSISGQPAEVSASLSANSVTPSGGNAASSILNVSVSPALAPTNFTLTITGTSGTLTHSATADVTVTATTSSTSNLIGDLLAAGCIDNGGIANALTSKLSAAQSAANIQAAINTLTALKNQINAQAGKHIATACNIGGVAFNPVTVLLLDVQGLIDSLRVSTIPDPITGYVVNSSGVGVAGATVSIVDAGGNVVATATTDITGFYFFATMSVLNPNSSYTVAVTGLPAGFMTAPPPSPAFTWSGSGLMIGNFVLN